MDHPLIHDEARRRAMFPVVERQVFAAHAGVAPLTAAARDAMVRFATQGAIQRQESTWFEQQVKGARRLAAQLIGATEHEISLLGPTALGLNMVAHGLDWKPGDQVVYYADDYPANVYCWMELRQRGVEPVALRTQQLIGQGAITWESLEPLLTDRTKLVALATCNFISGYRIDVDTIGRKLHERGILLCLDAIQTLGAFPTSVRHVDFLSADSHKWMLGPIGAGIFYVKRELQDQLRPALLGSWNVRSPQFVAQDAIAFEPGGRRYEPGTLNGPGIVGMAASLELLLDLGIEAISQRVLELHSHVLKNLRMIGYERCIADMPDDASSGILSVRHPSADLKAIYQKLTDANVIISLRYDRAGTAYLRFSPHFYNSFEELDRAIDVMRKST